MNTLCKLVCIVALLGLSFGPASAEPMSSNYPSLDGDPRAPLVLQQGNFDDDDETEIRMENRWLRLIVEPAHGGTISSFYDKTTGLELTKRSVQGDWGGLFRNVIDGNPSKMDWYMAPFTVKVVRDTPELAVVELSAAGRSGAYNGVTLTKRFTMTADTSRLKVDYEIYNNPISVEPLPFAMRMHNTVGVAGRKGHLFWPVERGMFRQEQPGGHYIWEPNPTRGFCGYATDEGEGLAFRMEYRLLRQFYYWSEHGTLPRSTLEWYMNELPVPADGTVRTSIYVLPFAGIVDPTGVTDEVVGRIDAAGVTKPGESGPVHIELASTVTGKRQVVVQVRRLPDGEPRTVHDAEIELHTGAKVSLTVPVTVEQDGTHEVIMELRHDGRPAGELRCPMVVQRAHMPYVVKPLEERFAPLAAPMLPKNFNFTAREVVTPHVPWAPSYEGGKTAFFLLTDGYYQREAVELAQRFEMEPASSFLTANLDWATYALGGYEGRISEQDLLGQMEKQFASHDKSDAILLSGPVWKWFTPWMRGALLERVQAGAGLVWIAPEGLTADISAALPLQIGVDAGVKRVVGALSPVGDHFITRGIPLAALGGVRSFAATALPAGTAIAENRSADGVAPLLVVGQFGAGRVVVINTEVMRTQWSGHGITPVRSDFPTFHNHEYELSLIGRALMWAAGKDGTAALHARVDADMLKATIDSPAERSAEMTVTFRDHFSTVIDTVRQPLSLAKGQTQFEVPAPVMPGGTCFAECILTDNGVTLDWHTVAFEAEHAAAMTSLEVDRGWYAKGDPIVLTAKATGELAGRTLRILVRDAYGRLLHRSTRDAAAEASIPLSIARPTTLRLYVRGELLNSAGQTVSAARASIDYRHIMQPDDLLVSFGFQAASQNGVPPYLMKPFYDALVRAGSTGWFHKPVWNNVAELDATRAANLPIQLASGPLHPGKTVIGSDARQRYEQSGDPTLLTRSPLIGEKFEKNLRHNVEELAAAPSVQWGAFDFYNGDESIFQPSDIDLSFDPVTLPIFRDWLKAQYQTLDALNGEWKTSFASWDEVMPMTRDKVVHHPSWAPWLDHRLFGDYTFARAYRLARQNIDELLPGMRSGASGTANTEQGTGWDWWQMRDSFTSLQPYGGDQTYQQRAFLLDVPQAGWLGYGQMETQRYIHSIWRWLSFGSMRGINIFSGRNNVNPDLTLPPTAKAFREALDTAAFGQARALFLARPDLDAVAFHYSPRSLWTAIPFGMRSQRQASSDGMTHLLNDANLQYDYVAHEQVENGKLQEGRHRLLFLRASTSLSDAEASGIRQFVEAGGVVVADLLPGVLTEHGRPRDAGALDDVFGIKQTGHVVVGKGTFDADGGAHGVEVGKLHLEIECATPFTATTATTLAHWSIEGQSGPALAINPFGKGLAICLGSDMLSGYGSARLMRHMERGQQILGAFERFRDSLFARAGIEPAVKVTDANGRLLPANVFRLHGKGVRFVSILGEVGQHDPFQATVHLPGPMHVFRLFDGSRVGHDAIDSFKLTIGPAACHVFALLEKMPGTLTVSVPSEIACGAAAEVNIAVAPVAGAPVDYALRVRTIGPDGQEFPPLTLNTTAYDGRVTLHLDAALDEKPGQYRLEVRNVLTAETAAASFQVR